MEIEKSGLGLKAEIDFRVVAPDFFGGKGCFFSSKILYTRHF